MAKAKIGGNERTIPDFSAAKAMEAGALVSAIIQKGGGLINAMGEYATRQRQATAVRVSRAAMYLEAPDRAAQVPDKAWEASGNVIELPGPVPGFEEQLLAVFPQVFELARDEVFKLLALVLVTDRELQDAETTGGADGVADLLATKGRDLRYEAKMEEVFALAAAAWEHCQEQLKADPTAQALLQKLIGLRSQSLAPSSAPASSTGSPAGTAGPAKRSSSRSPGRSSSPSAA